MDILEQETLLCHTLAYPQQIVESNGLGVGGQYAFRQRGEKHLLSAENIFLLQQATKLNSYDLFKQYSRTIDEQNENFVTLRGLLEFKKYKPIPIDEVEPVESIITRFATGAMSYGSISKEAHETLAIAMNSIGAKSNTGEGGEDASRFGTERNSKIKQVASGRFGVTQTTL